MIWKVYIYRVSSTKEFNWQRRWFLNLQGFTKENVRGFHHGLNRGFQPVWSTKMAIPHVSVVHTSKTWREFHVSSPRSNGGNWSWTGALSLPKMLPRCGVGELEIKTPSSWWIHFSNPQNGIVNFKKTSTKVNIYIYISWIIYIYMCVCVFLGIYIYICLGLYGPYYIHIYKYTYSGWWFGTFGLFSIYWE